MTGLVLLSGAALMLVARRRMAGARRAGETFSDVSALLNRTILEHLNSMKTTKSYAAEDRHARVFEQAALLVRDANMRGTAEGAALRFRLSVSVALVLAFTVYGAHAVLKVPAAHVLLLLFLCARLMPRLTAVYERVQTLVGVLPGFVAVETLEAKCHAAAAPLQARVVSLDLTRDIRLDNVEFAYRDPLAPALEGISLAIDVGKTTAIVGASGAGKSTLADVVMGLVAPSRGRLLVDGAPLRPEHMKSWRQQIGYVAQETFLFHDSVRANLLWARPGASDDELWHALRMAAADTFVRPLPDGIDTIVGDRAVLLSGGERQRLALARALVRRPRLLILDEATNALDSENEARIHRAVDALRGLLTIVIITHRMATIRDADTIHVLDRGRLVESGAWSALIERRTGRFAQLCRAQGIDDTRSQPRTFDLANR
jgi:ATP-binding cassette, subfamily C, bacterial